MSDLGPGGYALLEDFEVGPDGEPARVAYRCPGDRFTLWLGSTEWPNGQPVREGEMCTEAQGIELTNWSLRKFGEAVDKYVQVSLNQNQHDACRLLAFNIGVTAFANSTVVDHINRGADWEKEIAPAFGMWCKATSAYPNPGDENNAFYAEIIGTDSRGRKCWIGPDGQPCKYQRAYPGLSRRHLSEALLSLGYQWEQAARKDTIFINSRRVWDAVDNRWEDRIVSKTELADILPIAKRYPLTNAGGKAAIAIAGPAEAVHESGPQLSAGQRPASQTAPATNPDSSGELLLEKAASGPASAVSDKGGGGPSAAVSQPQAAPPLANAPPPPSQSSSAATKSAVSPAAGEKGVSPAPVAPPTPPKPAPPPPKDPMPTDATDAKTMLASKRFWGLAGTAIATSHMLPEAWAEWLNNEGNRELVAWLMVIGVTLALYYYGKAKAKKPLK